MADEMKPQTATQTMQSSWDKDMRVDLRRRHADMLLSEIMKALAPFLSEDRHAREDAAHAIRNLLVSKGAYVMTDHDRAEAGLPHRDDKGWTEAELRAYELRRLQVMSAPIMPLMPLGTDTKKPGRQ